MLGFTDELTQIAVLGTPKKNLPTAAHLGDFIQKIKNSSSDTEDVFFKVAAAAFLQEEIAFTAADSLPDFPPCTDDELLRPAPALLSQQIAFALNYKDEVWLDYLIFLCAQNKWQPSAVLLPALLDKAADNKRKTAQIFPLLGSTGHWLSSLQPAWQRVGSVVVAAADDDIWQTGTLLQRKEYFVRLRTEQPAAALQLLQGVFAQENAQVRREWLDLLKNNLSLADEAFLQHAAQDKSTKVAAAAIDLLKHIKGSALNKHYFNVAVQWLAIQQEKRFLRSDKIKLQWNMPPQLPPDLEAGGVEKTSSEKNIDDNIYWLVQVLSFCDPQAVAQHLGISEDMLLQLLLQHEQISKLVIYLGQAAVRFSNRAWAAYLIENQSNPSIELLPVFDKAQQKQYYRFFAKNQLNELVNFVCNAQYEQLEESTAKAILRQLMHQPYLLSEVQYRSLALYLPNSVVPLLQDFVHTEQNGGVHQQFIQKCAAILAIMDLRNRVNSAAEFKYL